MRHICPKPHTQEVKTVEDPPLRIDRIVPPTGMVPLNTHLVSSGSEIPLYIYIGDLHLRAYKCPICGLVEFYAEEPGLQKGCVIGSLVERLK